MAKNKIEDLRNHLFAQLERLGDDKDMQDENKLATEINRAKAIADVSHAIINSAKLEIDFLKAIQLTGPNGIKTEFITGNKQIE